MRITLVRHGETEGQSSIRYYGATDVPLSDTGREQMRRVAAALDGEPYQVALSSRLRRSHEAAELVAGGRFPVESIAGFDEVNFGRWEGWTREEILARDPRSYRLWRHGASSFRYPGGESRADFAARVEGALAAVLNGAAADSLLMVLHRGVIGVILARLLDLSPQRRAALAIDLGSIHVVERRNGRWREEVLDRVDHLPTAGVGP